MSTAAISHIQHPPMSSSPAAPSSRRIIQKRWVCDVCKTKWFLDFDKACAHEAVCAGDDRNDGDTATDVTSDNKEAVAADDATNSKSLRKEVIEIADSTDDSDSSPVQTRRSKRVRKDNVLDDSSGASLSKGKSSDTARSDKPTASIFTKAKKAKASKKETHAEQQPSQKKSKTEDMPKNAKRKKEGHAVKTSIKSGVTQQLLAEHNAASFFAKRKQAQQEERERQKKREEARRFAKKKGEENDAVVEPKDGEEGYNLGVIFPYVSHVLQAEHVSGESSTKRNATKPRDVLSYPHGKVDLLDSSTIEPMPNLSFFPDTPQHHTTPNIHNLFSSVFEPKRKAKKPSTKLWTEKHTISSIPDSILGPTNRQSGTKLSSFIEEWKIRRHKSTLLKKSKSKRRRRKSGYDSDDSFLDDECGHRTSLFLVTGPTGSGKSRMVHAISSALDCVVMEIHSGEVRGGGVLKKRVLESTQSHSSVALMKKREGGGALLLGKGGGGKEKEYFADESSSEDEEESSSLTVILIDEVDLLFQDHGDTGFWQALSQLSQKAKSPIILTATSMPQDMLYGSFKFEHIEMQRPTIEECCSKMEEVAKAEGMVLKQSTQGAESNEGLSLIAEYFQCDIRRILNEMQLFHASPTNNHSNTAEIDVFKRGWKARTNGEKTTNIEDDRPIILGIEPALIPPDDHTLVTIQGKNFQTTEPATLYLRGEVCSHFKVVNDSIILAVCPPFIIPDGVSKGLEYKNSTEDCPVKCYSAKFIDVVVRKRCANGLLLDSSSCPSPHRPNWNIEYDVSTEVSRLDQDMERQEFIRKAKANRKRLENEADNGFMSSDEEMDFEGGIQPSKKKVIYDSSSDEEVIDNSADKSSEIPKQHVDPQTLLNEAMSTVSKEQPYQKVIQRNIIIDSSAMKEVERFADEMSRMSDVAFLEDTLVGLPMLAGAMGGLGSQSVDDFLTDSIPADPTIDKLSKDSHHLPGFENSCLSASTFFYGNADTYMVRPCRSRERFLLNQSPLHSRGLGAVDHCTDFDNSEPSNSDSEENVQSTESKILSSLNYFEDDMLLPSHEPSTRLLLSSLLGKEVLQETSIIYNSNLKHGPWLDLRIDEMKSTALQTMSNILAPVSPYSELNWSKICFGIRLSERFNGSLQKGQYEMAGNGITASLSLDYLPYLRLMAFYENKVHSASQKILNDGTDKNTRTARSSKRRKPSCRAHYLATDYGNLEHDLSELGDSYLIDD